MSKIIYPILFTLFINTAHAEGRYYEVTIGYTPDGTGSSFTDTVWAESEVMACNVALKGYPGRYCWSIVPK